MGFFLFFFSSPLDLFALALAYYAWNVGGQVKFKGGKSEWGDILFCLVFPNDWRSAGGMIAGLLSRSVRDGGGVCFLGLLPGN